MQFECTLHNGRRTSRFLLRRRDLISGLPLAVGKFQLRSRSFQGPDSTGRGRAASSEVVRRVGCHQEQRPTPRLVFRCRRNAARGIYLRATCARAAPPIDFCAGPRVNATSFNSPPYGKETVETTTRIGDGEMGSHSCLYMVEPGDGCPIVYDSGDSASRRARRRWRAANKVNATEPTHFTSARGNVLPLPPLTHVRGAGATRETNSQRTVVPLCSKIYIRIFGNRL
ncbi:hypothetical protein EVAR_70707_1 [Eumeta japonica]|uniref:Uncharacterized protein n=1 Tax=Eumeta variegata TaxID=151549 RepID=A0A4C2A130_EUMVA|nr:hypothetical protein EVAR_70707_1 [Eumeta japonica]